jgi:hypothetical protein
VVFSVPQTINLALVICSLSDGGPSQIIIKRNNKKKVKEPIQEVIQEPVYRMFIE